MFPQLSYCLCHSKASRTTRSYYAVPSSPLRLQVQCNIDNGVFQPFCLTSFQSHDPDPFHRSLGDTLALSFLCNNGKPHSRVRKLSFAFSLLALKSHPVLESTSSPHLSPCHSSNSFNSSGYEVGRGMGYEATVEIHYN